MGLERVNELRNCLRRTLVKEDVCQQVSALQGVFQHENREWFPSFPLPMYQRVTSEIAFFGDSHLIHNRTLGVKTDFQIKVRRVQQRAKKREGEKLTIVATRFNFFRLKETVAFLLTLLNRKCRLENITLNISPLTGLYRSFVKYAGSLRTICAREGISLVCGDSDLEMILKMVSKEADPFNERLLLRLLGIVAEHAFIGPAVIVLDPYHRCNSNCVHCWVHTPAVKQPREFLDRKIDLPAFKAMADDMAELKVDTLIFQGDGEPLLYKPLMEMIEYATGKGIHVLFFTNGILLDENIARRVIELGVRQIYCSFPAGTAQTYSRVCSKQPPQTFYRIWENLKRLMRMRREAGKEHPHLIISHVIHNQNYRDLMDMARMDVDIATDAVRFYLIRLDVMNRFLQLESEHVEYMQKVIPDIRKTLEENDINLIDNIEFQLQHYNKKDGSWCEDVFLKQGCTIGWYFCLIPAPTDLSLCCHLRTVGWVNKSSLKELWQSEKYRRYRIQAKYLKYNKNVTFENGMKLYDEHCTHCDNHQNLLQTFKDLRKFGLYKYAFSNPTFPIVGEGGYQFEDE